MEPKELHVEWDLEAAEKGGYPDFMGKEIHEQPRAIADTLLGRLLPDGTVELDELRITDDELRQIDKVFVVACGSSYHAGMVAKYAIERLARLPTEIDIASEFRYRDPVLDERTLVVGVSQSGETIDTLQAMREARQWDAKIMVISNVVDSSMAREADGVLYTPRRARGGRGGHQDAPDPDRGARAAGAVPRPAAGLRCPRPTPRRSSTTWPSCPSSVETTLSPEREAEVAEIAGKFIDTRDFFFLGRHVGFPVALEGALKLKEISYVRAEGYPAGELKHGPIALIVPGHRRRRRGHPHAPVGEDDGQRGRGASPGRHGRARGQRRRRRHRRRRPTRCCGSRRPIRCSRRCSTSCRCSCFAYHIARLHGHNVDRPRNLAKTVTVE